MCLEPLLVRHLEVQGKRQKLIELGLEGKRAEHPSPVYHN